MIGRVFGRKHLDELGKPVQSHLVNSGADRNPKVRSPSDVRLRVLLKNAASSTLRAYKFKFHGIGVK